MPVATTRSRRAWLCHHPVPAWIRSRSTCRAHLRRRPVIVLQYPSAALAAFDRTPQRRLIDFLRRWLRAQGEVPQCLMWSIRVVVHQILPHAPARTPYAEKGVSPGTVSRSSSGPTLPSIEYVRHLASAQVHPLFADDLEAVLVIERPEGVLLHD
jgi:hypothetical protein